MVGLRTQLQNFEELPERRFEVTQTGHVGFSTDVEEEFKILNRVIKVDALKDELTLDADATFVDDALTTVELSGAKVR